MNKKFSALVLALASLGFAGCDGEKEDVASGKSDEVQLFEKGKGLRLPEELQRSLGVETAEPVERTMEGRVERLAHVYRAASEAHPARASALLDGTEAQQLREGQSVRLESTASSGASITGMLIKLESQTTNALGQMEALVEFTDREKRFPVGSFLNAYFSTGRSNAVPTVPVAALVRGVEGAFVYTVSGNHFARTLIKPGVEADGMVEIVDGLYAGDAVVVRAADALWMIELCALKGGAPCCPAPMKREKD